MTANANGKFHKPIVVKMATGTQYDAIKPVLEKFRASALPFDIYIPLAKDDKSGINKMFNKTASIVKNDGFENIFRKIPNKKYKLALSAPHFENKINAKYYLKYYYGPMESKPDRVWLPSFQNHYHGVILTNSRDAEVLSVYTKPYLVPILKYVNFKKKPHTKKTVLFLPTWDHHDDLGWILRAINRVRRDGFYAIVKTHPSGGYSMGAQRSTGDTLKDIEKAADEFYLGEYPLRELLARSDVVVSDTSSAAFEALYVGVPVTIFSKNINVFNLSNIKSANAKYTDEGYISIARDITTLTRNIHIALSVGYAKKQKELGDKLFQKDFTIRAVDSWMGVINKYLNDDINQDYIRLHDYYAYDYDKLTLEESNLRNTLDLERHASNLERENYQKLLYQERNLGIRTTAKRLAKAILVRLNIMKRKVQ
jgi:CDP-glycerol glycerophosphotransferase (TagB/SpsB family)